MSYRCPLCLKELRNEKLVRYCYTCNQAMEISGNTESLARNLRCQKRGCPSNQRIVEGVYLYHLGCRAANPLWKRNAPDNENDLSGKLEVPVDDDLDGKSYTISGKASFTHWQIGVLGRTARHQVAALDGAVPQKSASQLSEMWFPSMLLRMTAEKRPHFSNKKIGQIVGLVGIKNAGKTILALQALDREGYVTTNSNREIRIEDYIYSFPKSGIVIQPFFELLQLRSLMRTNKPFEMPTGTLRASTNLYTVFFHPTKLALRKKEKAPESAAKPSWLQQAKKLWDEGLGILPAAETFLFTLALYDIAGEDYERRVELVQELENKVDKIALVIDATDLIAGNPGGEKNLADCIECLDLLKRREKPFCVVLTKMDAFFKQALAKEPKIANVINPVYEAFYRGDQTKIKGFLKNWRDLSLLFKIKPHPHNQENFLKMLTSADGDFPIFLVETVNLPPPPEKQVSEQPITFGLDTFVCWCLEVEAEEIIENP